MTIVEKKVGTANDQHSPDDDNADIELAEAVEVQSALAIETIRRDLERHGQQRGRVISFDLFHSYASVHSDGLKVRTVVMRRFQSSLISIGKKSWAP